MNTQKFLIGVAVVAVLIFGGLYLSAKKEVPSIQAGSAVGPESSWDYTCNVGNCRYFRHQQVLTATSTVCSITSPNATTTLTAFSIYLAKSASYSTSYEIGWDTTAFSTTTALNNANLVVPANTSALFLASTTATGLAQDDVIPPKTYINVKLSTTTAGASATFAPVGMCNAIFNAVN